MCRPKTTVTIGRKGRDKERKPLTTHRDHLHRNSLEKQARLCPGCAHRAWRSVVTSTHQEGYEVTEGAGMSTPGDLTLPPL